MFRIKVPSLPYDHHHTTTETTAVTSKSDNRDGPTFETFDIRRLALAASRGC